MKLGLDLDDLEKGLPLAFSDSYSGRSVQSRQETQSATDVFERVDSVGLVGLDAVRLAVAPGSVCLVRLQDDGSRLLHGLHGAQLQTEETTGLNEG